MIRNILIGIFLPLLIILASGTTKQSVLVSAPTVEIEDVEIENFSLKKDQITSYFDDLCSKHGFNGALLVSQNGKVIYRNVKGYADYHNKTKLDTATCFELASVSKQFTAMSVLMLINEGVIKINDSIQVYYPEFPYKDITIKQLLTHRSGLPNYIYFCEELSGTETPLNNQDVVKIMTDFEPPTYYRPNRRFDYCNTNYALLASIVEKVSGMKFSEFLKTKIFKPLDMNRTFVVTDRSENRNFAKGYIGRRWAEYESFYLDGVLGDKGIYSTLDDLLKWEIALFTNKLIPHNMLQEAFTPAHKELRGSRNYGYGWRLRYLDDGSKMVYHTGWWRGFNSMLIHLEEDNSSIIILSNRVNKTFMNNFYRLLNILYPSRKKFTQTTKTNPVAKKSNQKTKKRKINKRKLENETFSKAKKEHNISAYQFYLKKYPKGKFSKEANTAISRLLVEEDDNLAFEEAIEIGTINAFNEYKQDFPKGIHIEEANVEIERLELEINERKKKLDELKSEAETKTNIQVENHRNEKINAVAPFGIKIQSGYYIVLHKFNNCEFAKSTYQLEKAKGIECMVVFNESAGYYYVVHTPYPQQQKSQKRAIELSNEGYSEVLIHIY